MNEKDFKRRKRELLKNYKEKVAALEKEYQFYKELEETGLVKGSYIVMWEREKNSLADPNTMCREEQVVFAKIEDIIVNNLEISKIKTGNIFGIIYKGPKEEVGSDSRWGSQRANYSPSKYTRHEKDSALLNYKGHGIQPISENLVKELKEILYRDSGKYYLTMHDKFDLIRKRLFNENYKVRVHLVDY